MSLNGLSVRAANALLNMGIETRRDAVAALMKGLNPATRGEVSVWVGLPKPEAKRSYKSLQLLLALALSELEHCATLVNDHGRPGAVIKQIKEGK